MITRILLAFVARSADSIVTFVQHLDQKLETFLAQHDEEVLALEADIVTIREHADADIADIRAEIADRQGKAAIVAALKTSLPGSTAPAPVETPAAPADNGNTGV
ncbi:MAG TPA: hypothetical protein VF485_10535 [Sphingomonas sp.]